MRSSMSGYASLRNQYSVLSILFYFFFLAASPLSAGDWPQILGPQRNGLAEGEKLASTWPAGGPKMVWQKSVGRGFAGVAVAGGQAIVFHRVGDEEVAECQDAKTGELSWKAAFPTR